MGKNAIKLWQTQASNITTNNKGKVDFFPTELSTTKIMTWECHMYDCAESRYDLIFSRDQLTVLVLDLNISHSAIIEGGKPFEGYTASMFHLGMYNFNLLYDGFHPNKSTLLSFSSMSQKNVYF